MHMCVPLWQSKNKRVDGTHVAGKMETYKGAQRDVLEEETMEMRTRMWHGKAWDTASMISRSERTPPFS